MPAGKSVIPLGNGFMPFVVSLVTHGISLGPAGTSVVPLGIGSMTHVTSFMPRGPSLGACGLALTTTVLGFVPCAPRLDPSVMHPHDARARAVDVPHAATGRAASPSSPA